MTQLANVPPKIMLRVGEKVYGMMKSALHYWLEGVIVAIIPIGGGKVW